MRRLPLRWHGEKALFKSLDSAETIPSAALLSDCRAELRQRLENVEPDRVSFWDRIREGFTIHFHFLLPESRSLVARWRCSLIGIFGARMTPASFPGSFRTSGVVEPPATSRVLLCVEPVGSGRVQIVVDETTQRVLSSAPWTIKTYSTCF